VENKMKRFLLLLILLNYTNAYFQLVNKVVQGNYKYYNKYVSIPDLKQKALLSFYKNKDSCSEDELEKKMYKDTRNYCYREMTRRKKMCDYNELLSTIPNFDEPKSFDFTLLDKHEEIIIGMLLQNKSNLEIMDQIQFSFQRYKKYIHKLRNRFK
jgi:DNA-directed RNA polymerase specialized sigma24 family protein